MPWWLDFFCPHCKGILRDGLFECFPKDRQGSAECLLLDDCKPGAAFACPYCNGLIGFRLDKKPQKAETSWPVLRYDRDALNRKREQDGFSAQIPLGEWYTQARLWEDDRPPVGYPPFGCYTYAEDAPANETVP